MQARGDLKAVIRKIPIIGGIAYIGYHIMDTYKRRQAYKTLSQQAGNDSETTVFLWAPDVTDQYDETSIGHMALQFGDKYVSLWPAQPDKPTTTEYVTKVLSSDALFASPQADMKMEGRQPNSVLKIRGLDHQKMQEKYADLQREARTNQLKFRVLYNFPFFKLFKTRGLNCSAAVNEVLAAGGFPVDRLLWTPWGSSPVVQYYYYHWLIGAISIDNSLQKKAAFDALLNAAKPVQKKR